MNCEYELDLKLLETRPRSDFAYNNLTFNFDDMGDVIVIISGKTIKINKQKLQEFLLKVGEECKEDD